MKRFKKILVVFDSKTDNRALFDQAVDLARRNRAALMVVDVIEEAPHVLAKPIWREQAGEAQKPEIHIIEEFPFETSVPPASESPVEGWKGMVNATEEPTIEIQEIVKQEEQRRLQQFITAIQHAGIQVNGKTMYGIPFIEIIQEVLRSQHDLVMITAEGRGGLKETLFGNTTMHLMRKCPCPVWVIKPGQPRQFGRILAAVDLVQDDKDRTALAKKIIELATSLARLGQSELLIVHAWRMYGESMIRGRGGFSTEEVERSLREAQDAHRQWLTEFLQQHPLEDLKYKVYLLKGEAGPLITELAQAKAIDLIVMGTVSRAGIAGLLIGNTAEKVLQQVDCSMLTVKPEGFVTSVKLDLA
jgi:universal stress protein E